MRLADPNHRAATRSIGYGLVAHDAETWCIVTEILRLRLARSERAALLFSALNAVDDEDLELTLDAALGGAGPEPHSYLISPFDEAKDWAVWSSDEERAAKCLANFRAMSPSYQRAFLAQVGGAA